MEEQKQKSIEDLMFEALRIIIEDMLRYVGFRGMNGISYTDGMNKIKLFLDLYKRKILEEYTS